MWLIAAASNGKSRGNRKPPIDGGQTMANLPQRGGTLSFPQSSAVQKVLMTCGCVKWGSFPRGKALLLWLEATRLNQDEEKKNGC